MFCNDLLLLSVEVTLHCNGMLEFYCTIDHLLFDRPQKLEVANNASLRLLVDCNVRGGRYAMETSCSIEDWI